MRERGRRLDVIFRLPTPRARLLATAIALRAVVPSHLHAPAQGGRGFGSRQLAHNSHTTLARSPWNNKTRTVLTGKAA
eukprot:scaffold1513_cov177-Isochrysis_galbana.AAC.4